jgi:hypothetical protein
MKKSRIFRGVKFPVAAIREAISLIETTWKPSSNAAHYGRPYLRIYREDETWHHDNEEEFFSDYARGGARAYFGKPIPCGIGGSDVDVDLEVNFFGTYSEVTASAPQRAVVERIVSHFEEWSGRAEKVESEVDRPTIFIGHGGSSLWRDLKDHLRDKHGFEVVAYETGARAGHSIRDILDDLVDRSSFALLVLTAEDSQESGQMRARQNVVHEVGLFQGRLGFSRAIAVVEQGVEVFTNLDGIQQIRFGAGNIKETFGEVLATLRREFEI